MASSQKPAAADTVANCADFTASDTECGANPTIVVARLLAAEVEDSSGSGPSVDCILNQFTAQAPSTWNDANLDICADAFPANTGAAGEPTQTCCNAAILTPLSELIVDKGKDTLRMAKNMKITKAIKEIFKVFKRCEWTPADFFTTNTEGTTE